MKTILIALIALLALLGRAGAACSSCGSLGASGQSQDTGPYVDISMGDAQYGQSAGELTFSSSIPVWNLYSPGMLQFDAASRQDVAVATTNVISTEVSTITGTAIQIDTNTVFITNNVDGTNYYATNFDYSMDIVAVTNTTVEYATNATLRQIYAPQALADIPPPPTTNGYVVNFYYPSQVGSQNPDGTYQVSGTPFTTWIITNTDSTSMNQLQISQFTPTDGLLKQWNYSYSTNTGAWTLTTLAGIQETMLVTNLDDSTYQVINTLQYSNGPAAQQTKTTYQVYDGAVAPVEIDVGSGADVQTTTYVYYSPGSFGAGTMVLPEIVTHPDGSQDYYGGYTTNGLPTSMYSTFQDDPYGRYTAYNYDPSAVSGSGDDGSLNPEVPRQVIEYVEGQPVSLQYTVFPSAGVRLDIQCLSPSASWNTAGNLVTTNLFYTSGPNQYALQAVMHPDGTLTTYNYITNDTYQTNITVTGQPDSTGSYVVDGVSNVAVLNISGYMVSAASYDVLSGLTLSSDAYGNFDNYGRPQQVTHLDGTTEYMNYACCGLANSVDSDGVNTVYLYDSDKRQYGYEKIYSGGTSNAITFENNLDAVGHALQSFRVGSDDSSITLSQSAYDTSGELIGQTNALNGVTTHTWTNASTGGFIRTITNPDGGVITNSYYADGSLKQTSGSGVHGARYVYGTGTDVNGNSCATVEEIKLNNDGSDSSETTITYTDMAGRQTEIYYADGHYSQSFYNGQGQLASQIDPDNVTNLYAYNAKGELAYTAIDMNGNGMIDFSGPDRINQTTNDVITDHGTTVRRTQNYAWLAGSSTGTLVSATETSADGLDTWQTQYSDGSVSVTTHSHTVPGVSRTMTTTMPDGSYTISDYSYGRLISSTRYDSTGAQIGGTTYGYDPQGRQNTVTDARNGATTLGFNNADQVATNTSPNPGGGSPETTITAYNTMMQATSVTQPDGTTVDSVWLPTGELGEQYGSRTYPVAYSYDYAGRMQTMTNWSNFAGNSGARVTTWNYDPHRGWLTQKKYDDGNGPSYTYTAAGRLASRAWVRGITTSYAYDAAGSLTNVSYSDGTPAVTNSYDRLGRLKTVVCNGITDTLTYNLANQLLSESFSGGVLNGLSVSNSYDSDLHRASLTALSSGSSLSSATYAYDNASRLSSVTDGDNNSAAYSYLANSPLVSQIVFKQSGTTRMTTTKQYDYLNRLTQISSAPSAAYTLPLTFNYTYNSANQRTHDTLADGSYWIYGYDALGQVTNACKYFADGTPVAGQQFDYTFDTIGNRTQTLAGGDATGANLRTNNYYANNLNQITNRDVAPDVDIMGASILTNAVTVNGQTAYRNQEYFRQQLAVNNTNSALWTNIIVTGGQSVTGNVYVAQQPEVFKYDADGNLTNDGRWAYTWDGENRLTTMTVNTNVGPQYQLNFAYDYQGRRIQKMVSTNGVGICTNKFLYDGWNLIAELNPASSLVRSYMWGSDLSGSMQGAGGVGGLLEVSYYGSSTTNCFPAFDGNGNVVALINVADGTAVANYDYAAFGEPIRITGVMAKNNPFRFSTKYDDDESDLLYYGYRYYKPSTGTWRNHDPLGEPGFEVLRGASVIPRIGQIRSRTLVRGFIAEKKGPNLYAFVKNDPESKIDLFGLDDEPDVSWAPAPCPNSQKTIFIQVFYGGWGPYSGPRTDDGSAGFFGGGSKGCPDYNPPGMDPGVFQDSPSGTHGWLTGPVQFIVCRVCEQQCCNGGWKIASIGPCVYWKKGDKGDLSDSGTFTTVDGPPQTWQVGLQNNYPNYANGGCAKCKN